MRNERGRALFVLLFIKQIFKKQLLINFMRGKLILIKVLFIIIIIILLIFLGGYVGGRKASERILVMSV